MSLVFHAQLERDLKRRAHAYTAADSQLDKAKRELAISCAAAINAGASYRQLATLIDRPLGSVHKLVHRGRRSTRPAALDWGPVL